MCIPLFVLIYKCLHVHISFNTYIYSLLTKSCFFTYRGVENIQAGIGDQAGLMIRDVSIFLGGLLWALFINWKLTIVMFSLLPLVSVLSALNIKVC